MIKCRIEFPYSMGEEIENWCYNTLGYSPFVINELRYAYCKNDGKIVYLDMAFEFKSNKDKLLFELTWYDNVCYKHDSRTKY